MSTSQDPHPEGGSLSSMAATGTTVPDSSATPRTIPSKPRPDQTTTSSNDPSDLGSTSLAGVADNASDMPRSVRDQAPTSSVITGTGDALPDEASSKRLHELGNPDLSKGHARYDKHVRQKGSDEEKGAVGMGEDEDAEEVRDGVVGGRP
ncbi:MAG: hypothetical protein L6R40_005045 [Gallowayella cf. fulva]|nr:MAG: hypothetical protein L6R40_005045 [Xanthomendoza cf. fulva]